LEKQLLVYKSQVNIPEQTVHPTARHAEHSVSFKLFVPLSQKKIVFASVILAVFFLVKFDLPWRHAEFRHNDSYKIYDSYTNGFFPKKKSYTNE